MRILGRPRNFPLPSGRQFVNVVALCSLSGYVSAAGSYPSVNPNQDFSNPTLQLHSPDSSAWHGYVQTPTMIAFAKTGSIPHESFIAQVNLVRLPAFADSEAFTEFVREDVIKGSPTERFETLEVNIQYSPDRGYPCVTYHAVSNDKKARVSSLFRKTLRFEIFALYCQHPLKPGLVFAVVYSHRGGTTDENIDKEAGTFIDSVQVTRPSQAP
jgi:hypothetical protein